MLRILINSRRLLCNCCQMLQIPDVFYDRLLRRARQYRPPKGLDKETIEANMKILKDGIVKIEQIDDFELTELHTELSPTFLAMNSILKEFEMKRLYLNMLNPSPQSLAIAAELSNRLPTELDFVQIDYFDAPVESREVQVLFSRVKRIERLHLKRSILSNSTFKGFAAVEINRLEISDSKAVTDQDPFEILSAFLSLNSSIKSLELSFCKESPHLQLGEILDPFLVQKRIVDPSAADYSYNRFDMVLEVMEEEENSQGGDDNTSENAVMDEETYSTEDTASEGDEETQGAGVTSLLTLFEACQRCPSLEVRFVYLFILTFIVFENLFGSYFNKGRHRGP